MRIGPVVVSHPITLAPLEEHSNYCFRALMKQFGASLVCSERVDARLVVRRDRRAMRLLYTLPGEAPRAGQISGPGPAVMAEAARIVAEAGFDIVDLNFDCPALRVLKQGEGGALLADPPAIARIVQTVVRGDFRPGNAKNPQRSQRRAGNGRRGRAPRRRRRGGSRQRSRPQRRAGLPRRRRLERHCPGETGRTDSCTGERRHPPG